MPPCHTFLVRGILWPLYHQTDVGGVVLNLHTSYAVEKAYTEMKESVSRLASPEGFEGVTVQPMISLKGYEIILGFLAYRREGTSSGWDG